MSEFKKRILTSFFLLIVLICSFINIKSLFILLIFINFLSIDEFIKILKKIYKKNNFHLFITTFVLLLYMIYFSLVIYAFLNKSFDINKIYVIFILLICASTDIGGFMFGKMIGGKKLTKISPNKTYAGLFGSIAFSLVVGLLFYNFQDKFILNDLNILVYIILISFFSQIGDLFISYLKRKAKIKDTGTFLPGHGGILDRIDGMLLALPISIIILAV